MLKLTMTRTGAARCMKRTHGYEGVDPYNSADAYAARASRMLADKARRARDRDPYPFHRSGK